MIEPERKAHLLSAAQLSMKHGLYQQARAILETCLRENANDPDVLAEYAMLLARGFKDYPQALNYIRRALALNVSRPDYYVIAAEIHLLRKDKKSAIEMLEVALRWDPEHPEARRMRQQMGIRRKPVLPFLDRKHPLNIFLGKIRHRLKASKS